MRVKPVLIFIIVLITFQTLFADLIPFKEPSYLQPHFIPNYNCTNNPTWKNMCGFYSNNTDLVGCENWTTPWNGANNSEGNSTGILIDQSGHTCSGTLVGENLFLTAAHCIDFGEKPLGVQFKYTTIGAGDPSITSDTFFPVDSSVKIYIRAGVPIDGLLEHSFSNDQMLDYALIKLTGNPSDSSNTLNITIAPIVEEDMQTGDPIAVIGHPGSFSKKTAVGIFTNYATPYTHVTSSSFFSSDDIDSYLYFRYPYRVMILGENLAGDNFSIIQGSSGSGVFDAEGRLRGIIHWTDCTNRNASGFVAGDPVYLTGHENAIRHWAMPISDIVKASPTLKRQNSLFWVTGPGSMEHGNETRTLLPFGKEITTTNGEISYRDNAPIVLETDQGWPVLNAAGTELRYMLFGDTTFFLRDPANPYCLMNNIASIPYFLEVQRNECSITDPINVEVTEFVYAAIQDKYDLLCNPIPPSPKGLVNFCKTFSVLLPIATENFDSFETHCQATCTSTQCFGITPECNCAERCSHIMALEFLRGGYFPQFLLEESAAEPGDNYAMSSIIFEASIPENSSAEGLDKYKILLGDHVAKDTSTLAKGIYLNGLERSNNVMVYPYGSFYVCPGNNTDCSDSEKKLFILTHGIDWSDIFEGKAGKGLYNFTDDCRVDFYNNEPNDGNYFACKTVNFENVFFTENPNNLWSYSSPFYYATVVQGLENDIYTNNAKKYIYFIGNGYQFDNIGTSLDRRIYMARVEASEYAVTHLSGYEYFTGIQNGVSQWSSSQYSARSLFYDLRLGSPESIIYHDGLYWMTITLNEFQGPRGNLNYLYDFSENPFDPITEEMLYNYYEENRNLRIENGVIILSSPDAFTWRLADKLVYERDTSFEETGSISSMYGFLWYPPALVDEEEDFLPFLYSVWKTEEGFHNDYFDPKVPTYNVVLDKYHYKQTEKTRSYITHNDTVPEQKDISCTNDLCFVSPAFIGAGSPSYTTVPFRTFQNLTAADSELHNELITRSVMIQYCYCDPEETYEHCKNFTCLPNDTFTHKFDNSWQTLSLKTEALPFSLPSELIREACLDRDTNEDPDYLCDIDFSHDGVNTPEGLKNLLVWNWRQQISENKEKEYETFTEAKIFLRFSQWKNSDYISTDNPTVFAPLDRLLLHNIGLSPLSDQLNYVNNNDPDSETNYASSDVDKNLWKTTDLITLEYKKEKTPTLPPGTQLLSPPYGELVVVGQFPAIYGSTIFGPGDPPPAHLWLYDLYHTDLMTAHTSVAATMVAGENMMHTPANGAAMTIGSSQNGTMRSYLWGGTQPIGESPFFYENAAQRFYIGLYDEDSENIVVNETLLAEPETTLHPFAAAGATLLRDTKNNILYLVGVLDRDEQLGRIFRMDFVEISDNQTIAYWQFVGNMPARHSFSVVRKSQHEFFLIGGESFSQSGIYSDEIIELDLESPDTASVITYLPDGAQLLPAATYNPKAKEIYLAGGRKEDGTLSSDFRTYNTTANSWTTLSETGPSASFGGMLAYSNFAETVTFIPRNPTDSADSSRVWTLHLDDESWTIHEIIEGENEENYCLESGSQLAGGILTDECEPFTAAHYLHYDIGQPVLSVAGKGNALFIGTADEIIIYDVTDKLYPVEVSRYTLSNPAYDMKMVSSLLYLTDGNGIVVLSTLNPAELTQIASMTLYSNTNFLYSYSGPVTDGYGNPITTSGTLNDAKTLKRVGNTLFVGDGHGVSLVDITHPSTPQYQSGFYTSGNIEAMDISDTQIYLYDRMGLKIYDLSTLNQFYADYDGAYCNDPTFRYHETIWYAGCNSTLNTIYLDNPSNPWENEYNYTAGDRVEIENPYTVGEYAFFSDGNTVRVSKIGTLPDPICGNEVVEIGESCDSTTVACTSLSGDYISGDAPCNSTCSGYDETNCEEDGW